MIADTSQCLRKWYLFTDNRCRLVKIPFPGYSRMYLGISIWAGRSALTGYDVLCHGAVSFMIFTWSMMEPVGQTSIHAPQKRHPASFKVFPSGIPARTSCVCLYIIQHLYAAEVLTGADTSSAADASGEQVDIRWVAVVIGNTSGFLPPALRANAHVLVHGLEFTSAIFGTARSVCG